MMKIAGDDGKGASKRDDDRDQGNSLSLSLAPLIDQGHNEKRTNSLKGVAGRRRAEKCK